MAVSQTALYVRDSVPLPPPRLRAAGPLFKPDEAFLQAARQDRDLLRRFIPLKDQRVLDFGCGVARLYFGLEIEDEPTAYIGLDVRRQVIGWNRRNISACNPRFSFAWRNVHNARYNFQGALEQRHWSTDLTGPYDVIYSYSVFSHMTLADAKGAAGLFREVLADDGMIFVTAFVRKQSEPILINPENMGLRAVGPLHIVSYDERFFPYLFKGFTPTYIGRSQATDGQSIYLFRRAPT